MLTDSEVAPAATLVSGMPARMRSATSSAPCSSVSMRIVGELLAAEARGQVDVTHRALDDAGDGAQRPVAGAVAVQLVEGAEVVEVAEQQREPGCPGPGSARSPR